MKQVGRKRERYHHNDDETHVKIAKYSCECRSNAAADKFTKELGFLVTKSTVRNMKKSYLFILRKEKDPERIWSLPHGARGRLLILCDYDQDISRYIISLREAGGIDLRASIVKPLHGNWLMMTFSFLKEKKDIKEKGFEKSGILSSITITSTDT